MFLVTKEGKMLENAKELVPGLLLIEDAIQNPQEIIEKAFEKSFYNEIKDAEVIFDNEDSTHIKKEIRNTKLIDITPSFREDVFWWLVAQKLWEYGNAYASRYEIAFSAMESPQFLFYEKGEGFYRPHYDTGQFNPRIFSLVAYLNDVEEGGETHFEYFNVSVKPKAGSLIMFPSDFVFFHGAKTPISDNKCALITCFNP